MAILIVDDAPEILELLEAILDSAGFTEFLTAETADEAFKELGMDGSTSVVEEVDLILMDVKMPEIDGIEACRLIKAEPQLRDIPIIMVTGLADEETLEAAFGAGAMDFVNKPVNRVEVLARVRSALSLKQEVDIRKLAYIELERANEDLAQESLTKSQILSTVTHELKTPLTSIVGYADRLLLRQDQVGQLNERQQRYIEAIRESSSQLSLMISDLLDISRMESGKLELTITEIDLTQKIDDVIRRMQSQFDEKQICVLIEIPTELGAIQADDTRLSQVITNLLSNACKYSPVGSTVTVTATEDAEFVKIDVSDSGMGISKDDQSKLFTKFFRADNTPTRTESGTGLGLFIVKQLIQAQGGKISVESETGIGSTFSFTLPRAGVGIVQQDMPVETNQLTV